MNHVLKCYHCGKQFDNNKSSFKLFLSNAKMIMNGKKKLFCDDHCYDNFLQEYFVEEYKENSIYSYVPNDSHHCGEKIFIPYLGCRYYFLTLDECKNRIDNKYLCIW